MLTHAELHAHDTFARPDVVAPKAADVKGDGPGLRCVLPPASVSRVEVKLA